MANEIYNSTWWGNTIDTASSIGTSTDMIQGQFNLTKLGDELVVNGDFATDSDWNKVGDFIISNGNASIINASQYSQITNQFGVNYLLSGKKYKLQVDIPTLSISNAFAYRVTGGTVIPISTLQVINGVFEAEFTMTQNGYFWFQTTGSYIGLNVSIDNVSVKEVRATTVEAVKCLADAIHRIGIQNIQN